VNFDLKITKIDILTIVLLSILFFGIAAWNVGEIIAPTTNWQTTGQQSFYIDLGSSQQLQNTYFWVKNGNATLTVYSGSPNSWSYVGNYTLQDRATDYSVQKTISLNVNTQYLRFDVAAVTVDNRPNFSNWGVTNPTDQQPSPFIEVTEIGLASPDNIQIPIASITGINGTDTTISALVDEQGKLQISPTYMSKMYFDEVYFARSAEDYVNHVIPMERTHPPLGKLVQAVGVLAFGETPFGWRIMGVIFGTLLVPLMYLLGKKLFGTWIGGFSAAFLFSFDFMHFTMARIGTVDTYVVFFSLVSQIFFLIYFTNVLKKGWKTSVLPLALAVIFTAFAFSTKWFSLFPAIGMLALLAALRLKDVLKTKKSLSDRYVAMFNHPFIPLIAFVGIAVAIYFATYIPEMLMGDSIGTILQLQNAMFGFHAGSVVDTSSSPWWSWPLMFRLDGATVPRWFDITYLPNNSVSTITVFGNPAVWWIGFAAMLVLAFKAFHVELLAKNIWSRISKSSLAQRVSIRGNGWDLAAIFIVVVYGFSWLAYVFIGRATYIYHYYLSVPLLCLAITYFINRYWHKPLGKVAAIAIFAATVAMFIAFYPVISGAPASTDYIHNLKWFSSWYFAP
jgi:4-amino-4-deoxy-L-arabinose transferase-like glycosyltransferase